MLMYLDISIHCRRLFLKVLLKQNHRKVTRNEVLQVAFLSLY